jgi:hypothetical protein
MFNLIRLEENKSVSVKKYETGRWNVAIGATPVIYRTRQ